MSFIQFDRRLIDQKSLSERKNKVHIAEIYVKEDAPDPDLSPEIRSAIHVTAENIIAARKADKSVMLSFGAHSIKNGLGPLMVKFIEKGWITHLATNGAGIIHDWEFAFQGESSESVADNLPRGQFGIWEETGSYLTLIIIAGAYEGLGYGGGVGKAIEEKGIRIPSEEELIDVIKTSQDMDKVSAAADFLAAIRKAHLSAGWCAIDAPYAQFSLQAGAYRLGVHSTDHPMFGHDIIYTHYLNSGSAIGRTAERDFKTFVQSFSKMDDGVYLSLGSAVMSPMLFDKAFKLCPIHGHHIVVVDIGELKKMDLFKNSSPASIDFIKIDNRVFLLALYHELSELSGNGE
jgi:hypothetical protein